MADVDTLIELFNTTFSDVNTVLVRGDDEPLYLPSTAEYSKNQIVFAHGFFASALHEIAHWCIAGPERRKQVDFGYWYQPDGRSAEQQNLFERVEVKPQALEWIFTVAAGRRFNLSADNLSGEGNSVSDRFKHRVANQTRTYLADGLPERAERWRRVLIEHYGTRVPLDTYDFSVEQLP